MQKAFVVSVEVEENIGNTLCFYHFHFIESLKKLEKECDMITITM